MASTPQIKSRNHLLETFVRCSGDLGVLSLLKRAGEGRKLEIGHAPVIFADCTTLLERGHYYVVVTRIALLQTDVLHIAEED